MRSHSKTVYLGGSGGGLTISQVCHAWAGMSHGEDIVGHSETLSGHFIYHLGVLGAQRNWCFWRG